LDYLLIGSAEPIRTPYASLTGRFFLPKVASDLQRINIRQPLDFLQRVAMSSKVGEYAKGAMLHTDDNALLEFAAPREMYRSFAEVPIAAGVSVYKGVDLSFLAVDPGQQDRLENLKIALEPLIRAQILGSQALAQFSRGEREEAFLTAGEAAKLDPFGPEILNAKAKTLIGVALDGQDSAAADNLRKQAAALAPNLPVVFQRQVAALAEAQRWSDAVDILSYAVFLQSKNLTVIDYLAWLQATSPDPTARNSHEALERASYCCQATDHLQPGYLKTLAAAHAEAGNFAEAVRVAENALSLARQSGETSLVHDIETQLSAYRDGKPYRLGMDVVMKF
jgi:Flp pilus assembly protein TadD